MITAKTSTEEMLRLAPACDCDKCKHGCRMGSGTFADGQLQKTAQHLNITEQELKEHYLEPVIKCNTTKWRPKTVQKPYGPCIFFDEDKGCTIHAVKPLECQIATGCKPHGDDATKWFLINQFVNTEDPESIRDYASLLNHTAPLPGAKLNDLIEDKAKLKKILEYKVIR